MTVVVVVAVTGLELIKIYISFKTFKRHLVVLFKIMSNVLRKGATCGAASIFSLTLRHACDAHASLKYVFIFSFSLKGYIGMHKKKKSLFFSK